MRFYGDDGGSGLSGTSLAEPDCSAVHCRPRGRARTLDGISLARPISMRDVRTDPVVIAFYRELGIDR